MRRDTGNFEDQQTCLHLSVHIKDTPVYIIYYFLARRLKPQQLTKMLEKQNFACFISAIQGNSGESHQLRRLLQE